MRKSTLNCSPGGLLPRPALPRQRLPWLQVRRAVSVIDGAIVHARHHLSDTLGSGRPVPTLTADLPPNLVVPGQSAWDRLTSLSKDNRGGPLPYVVRSAAYEQSTRSHAPLRGNSVSRVMSLPQRPEPSPEITRHLPARWRVSSDLGTCHMQRQPASGDKIVRQHCRPRRNPVRTASRVLIVGAWMRLTLRVPL